MSDYVNREVARDRLRKACKAGTIVSVLLVLVGILYGGIAALVFTKTAVPRIVAEALYFLVPAMGDTTLAVAECGSRAALFFLLGLVGLLMFRKVAKTGDAFRVGQLKQFKFLAFLVILLGFLPTVVANGTKAVIALRSGLSPFAALSFAFDVMSIIGGLYLFMVARMMVAGAVLASQADVPSGGYVPSTPEPDFGDVPDLSNVTTAQEATSIPDYADIIAADNAGTTLEQPPSDPLA